MANDKERLNIDLSFLEEAKPREAETTIASSYKVNWRNICIIGGGIVAVVIWIALSDNSSPRGSTPSNYTPSASPAPQVPNYQPSATDGAMTVTNGQFTCSRDDSTQADLLSPTNRTELDQEEKELERRSRTVDSLKAEVDTSDVNQKSSQAMIDAYNASVAQYNKELTGLQSAYQLHQANIDTFNQRIEAHNNYLLAHCTKGQ